MIERPRFFPRQLVTPDDLTLGQDYFRNKIRRINRYLHGWGVVCGTRVVNPKTPQPWKVVIQTGYILGPYGDEIVIDRDICFDLRVRCMEAAAGDACTEVADPLCPDQTISTRRGEKPYYIAVRYKDMAARPVRVQPAGCGCDDSQCEYSRWRDGYEICVLDECPDAGAEPPDLDQISKQEGIPDCPPCPSVPWVVLAEVTTDGQGRVTKIDNCKCRRMVRTLAPYWWRCKEPAIVIDPPPGPVD
ncbi:MAG: hypothetical protein R2762_02765 [Bryobacteraceae bacterium]